MNQIVFIDYDLKKEICKNPITALMSCSLVCTSVRVSISHSVLKGI